MTSAAVALEEKKPNPIVSRDEYNRMLLERLHGERRWENEPATGWTVADLDEAEIVQTLEEAIRRGRAEDPRIGKLLRAWEGSSIGPGYEPRLWLILE